MYIAGIYSFNHGKEVVESRYPHLLEEIVDVINIVDAEDYKTKISEERTMQGRLLYNPAALNRAFKREFVKYNWKPHKEKCEYPTKYYTEQHKINSHLATKGAFREMDFVKEKLGVEVQFGKYAFMVYNVCAKMTIFSNKGVIDVGVEIVPIKEFANEMSTGVSYFEQFVWDLEQRGVSNIDIPVMILGVNK